jgi:DUF3025 family protein
MPAAQRNDPFTAWDAEFIRSSPLLIAFVPTALALGARSPDWPDHDELNRLHGAGGGPAANALGLPVRFVPAAASAPRDAPDYEAGILASGEVPTRSRNWHDLFNALAWLTFPRTKAALNLRHCLARGARPPGAARGRVEDALTGFDESGIVVACADEALARLLLGFRWKELFWFRREAVRSRMGFFGFGHGLCEQALDPFVGMTGKGILVRVTEEFFGAPLEARLELLDGTLAAVVSDPGALLSARELAPVPLLGVPGWWPPNETESFYDNTAYFRPGRIRA